MSRYLSSEERRSYEIVRAEAQARANETGADFGVERNELMREWGFFMLPGPQNRYGFELRCEVVHPMTKRTETR
jgi:hypothetical protein